MMSHRRQISTAVPVAQPHGLPGQARQWQWERLCPRM